MLQLCIRIVFLLQPVHDRLRLEGGLEVVS